MKKLIALSLVCICVITLFSCGKDKSVAQGDATITDAVAQPTEYQEVNADDLALQKTEKATTVEPTTKPNNSLEYTVTKKTIRSMTAAKKSLMYILS